VRFGEAPAVVFGSATVGNVGTAVMWSPWKPAISITSGAADEQETRIRISGYCVGAVMFYEPIIGIVA
jgi:hypothetical protein